MKSEENMDLVGKVIRLHSTSQPDRFKLYMVIDGEYDSFSYGKVTLKTIQEWIKNGLTITVYEEMAITNELVSK